ncbi:MAG: hypothetical protein IJN64_05675 [Lachnospiraceae bacterium]|nr:hypothetical protein [Tyzzerella sp.]MBQ6993957.1 hypothetical protein [Lachnospiraceae bacterium]
MKIKVGRYVRVYFCLGLLLGMVGFIYHITNLCPFENVINYEDIIISICSIPFYFGLAILYILVYPRAFAIIKIQGTTITSFLFGKEKCKIDIDKEVYYAIVEANPERIRGAGGTFIVISNECFLYEQRKKIGRGIWKKEKPFENYYDMKQMILIPYNENTKSILPIEQWKNCLNESTV